MQQCAKDMKLSTVKKKNALNNNYINTLHAHTTQHSLRWSNGTVGSLCFSRSVTSMSFYPEAVLTN